MDEKRKEEVKEHIRELREKGGDPQVFSQERRVWENALIESKSEINTLEERLIYRREVLKMVESKLEEVK